MPHTYQASRQWERISRDWVTAEAAVDLTDFKSERPNHKISLWDPGSNGVRYLKTMVHNMATGLSPADWDRLRRTRNRDVGNPHAVRWDGEDICLDYLQATLELGFIEERVELRGAAVLEIGAGYGRTCHTLLSNHDIATYCIVDLPTTMELSKRYLRTVLDDERFARIDFVTVDEVDDALASRRFDLSINIDSLAEMFPETAGNYLALIDRCCAAFYTKNPVGKYLDRTLDGRPEGEDELLPAAMETGLLRQVLDVHDSRAVRDAVPGFLDAYRPGDGWSSAADAWAAPWSFYWQALYRKGGTAGNAGTGGKSAGAAL
ncbi:putative sugar O-methyltransferase [Streptomyces uncialis]|uniref:Methyltransferase n=1 Tax=Streptomyces uncialis TaxID=1048205 RepID=A0A1Q4VED4_9ACTN|nr:putative sugar O-methyltransferase [Streptomyces uncialis]MCX4660510.1 putative sugar O-methyltransferase [Streptomyces uncialis]OKH96179.1 methyltransferase [Streptomyces uncialis]WTE12854.1 putative sugar O-methyltransferase [Streptomyces uncialis]